MIICIVKLQKRGIDENTFQKYLSMDPFSSFMGHFLEYVCWATYSGEQLLSVGIHKHQVSLTFGAFRVILILSPKVSHLSFPSLLSC